MKTFKQIIAEVEEPKSASEKAFKDKHVIQKTDDVAGNDDAVYKGSKVKKDKSKKSGHEGNEDEKVYEEVEEDDMTEGRRPKAKDGEEEGGEHIAMQLRKSISMRGQKAVRFNDGKEVKVSMRDADKFFKKFNRTRMAADKIKMTRNAAKSYDHFKKIIDEDIERRADVKMVKVRTPDGKTVMRKQRPEIKVGEDEVKELSTKTLGSYISKASDASKHRGLPTRKVDNRYSGVARASKKLDQRESVDEGMMKNIAIDLKDLDAAEFQRKYNMSKADAMKKFGKPESVQIEGHNHEYDSNSKPLYEVRMPPFKEVMKVIGHTKNAVEGRAALKKKYGVTDKQADQIIMKTFNLDEKTLTSAEKKKREEIAQAIQRDNPDMPMDKKMAIATATAKRVAEDVLYEADAITTLQKAAKSSSPMRIKFDSGTSENLDKQTAEQLLDVHKKLNSSNKKRFEQNLFKSSLDFMKMVDFAVKKAG